MILLTDNFNNLKIKTKIKQKSPDIIEDIYFLHFQDQILLFPRS